jgi:hypothetical protein
VKITGDSMKTLNIEGLDESELLEVVEALKAASLRYASQAEDYKNSSDVRYDRNEHLRWEDIAFCYAQAGTCARLANEIMWEYDHEGRTFGWVAPHNDSPTS